MSNHLSFASIARLHNNHPLNTSPIGELSNKARTYAKDPGVFDLGDNVLSATVLYNFLSTDNNTDIAMPQAYATKQIEISNWLYAQAKLGNITNSRQGTLSLLRATFTSGIEILDVGTMVTNTSIWLPSYIEGEHIVGNARHGFKLWFAEEYFRDQYPVVSFTIVHPLPLNEIDSLMTMNFQQLDARLALETPDVIEDRLKSLTDNVAWPYTDRTPRSFEVLDLINRPYNSKAFWHVVSWGNGADAEDQLFDQIQKEILDNSTYPRSDWEEKIPDLFNPMEFYAIPGYDTIGLVNRTNNTSTYSPITDRETMLRHVNRYLAPNMPESHLIKSHQVVPFLYKSVALDVVAKVNNREGTEKIISDVFSDYQLIPSLDSQFDSMSPETKEFIRNMENLIAAAETVTPISLPPSGISRIERFGLMWVTTRIGKVKVMVLTRHQMEIDGLFDVGGQP